MPSRASDGGLSWCSRSIAELSVSSLQSQHSVAGPSYGAESFDRLQPDGKRDLNAVAKHGHDDRIAHFGLCQRVLQVCKGVNRFFADLENDVANETLLGSTETLNARLGRGAAILDSAHNHAATNSRSPRLTLRYW